MISTFRMIAIPIGAGLAVAILRKPLGMKSKGFSEAFAIGAMIGGGAVVVSMFDPQGMRGIESENQTLIPNLNEMILD